MKAPDGENLRGLLESLNEERRPSAASPPCPHCGEPYNAGAEACKHCGRRIAEKSEARTTLVIVALVIAAMLWFLSRAR